MVKLFAAALIGAAMLATPAMAVSYPQRPTPALTSDR